jgi:Holliday junction resolvase RusA-like endonuclease
LFGNGTLCVMDAIDAGIRSGGNFLAFFMKLNLIAWFRLVALVLKEVCIRVGITGPLQMNIEAYKRINRALQSYLSELEKIDITLFKKETEKYEKIVGLFSNVKTDKELNDMLLNIFDRLGFDKPWEGNFYDHMANKNGTLVFK